MNKPRIGLIELPAIQLLDDAGRNWTAFRKKEPLGSKQILAGSLREHFACALVNLKAGNGFVELGEVEWRGTKLRKMAVGSDWRNLESDQFDVWGVTVNYLQEREATRSIISYLASRGAKVIVGGSDAFAEPDSYVQAGATAVVMDKSGASNIAAIEIALGKEPASPFSIKTKNGLLKKGRPGLHPQQWAMPTIGFVKKTLGYEYWEGGLEENIKPIGAVMLDHGCDRHCDFCETPTYKLGYQAMPPERALAWVELQKKAGAKSFICLSDQFLGRILWPNGKDEILRITNGFREMGLPVLWGNGLELSKATLGHGFKNSDTKPDYELVNALWGWDGKVGCAQAYLPAERPLEGKKAYAKLLEWQSHVELLKAIVAAGVPDISYGVIVGLPDDDHNSLSQLLEAVLELRLALKQINPALKFRVTPFAVRPIPGTPMTYQLQNSGLLRFSDPAILGGFWTACADTRFITYEEVSDWQLKILRATMEEKDTWQQGFTALH